MRRGRPAPGSAVPARAARRGRPFCCPALANRHSCSSGTATRPRASEAAARSALASGPGLHFRLAMAGDRQQCLSGSRVLAPGRRANILADGEFGWRGRGPRAGTTLAFDVTEPTWEWRIMPRVRLARIRHPMLVLGSLVGPSLAEGRDARPAASPTKAPPSRLRGGRLRLQFDGRSILHFDVQHNAGASRVDVRAEFDLGRLVAAFAGRRRQAVGCALPADRREPAQRRAAMDVGKPETTVSVGPACSFGGKP